MNISLYLTRPKSESETTIFARICYSGYKMKFYTPEKIHPKWWNKETQQVKQTDKFREYPEFNARLKNIKAAISNVYRKYLNDNGVIPLPQTLLPLLEREIKKKETEQEIKKNFLTFFQEIIDSSKNGTRLHPKTGKPISPNTIKTYVTTLTHLKDFQDTLKKSIEFDDLTLEFYGNYTEYLIKDLKLSTNTVGKHIQVIKLIINEATERGLNNNLAFRGKRFVTLREKSDSIYLTESEIKELEDLNLLNNSKLDKVRDMFLIGCYTGLRYSDYSILRADQIKDGYIETTQIKTGDAVVIPVHPTVKKILDKYNDQLPTSISNQKTNEYLKDLGKMIPSFKSNFSKSGTKGGLRVTKNFEKWELLTTHVGRRSFCSNEFKRGISAITIMQISGHRSEKAFLKYIKLTPNEHAKLLKGHWDKRNNLQAV